MDLRTKEQLENLLSTAASISYTDNHELSQALQKILNALVLEDKEALTKIIQAIKQV